MGEVSSLALPWGSSDPYVSNPARGLRLKSTSRSTEWRTLYAFLAPLNHAQPYSLDTAFYSLLLGARARLESGPPPGEHLAALCYPWCV